MKVECRVDTFSFATAVTEYEMIETCDLFSGLYDFFRFRLEAAPDRIRLHAKPLFGVDVEGIEIYGGEDVGKELVRFIEAVDRVIGQFEAMVG